jgi:probable HAF family extracellular repeat protein
MAANTPSDSNWTVLSPTSAPLAAVRAELRVNNLGQVIGVSNFVPGDVNRSGFLYNNGAMVALGALGGSTSTPNKINNSGKVVGSAYDSPAIQRAFVYSDWTMKGIDTTGGKGSSALDVSDGGRVVGYAKYPDIGSRAFLYNDDTGLIDLNNLLPGDSGWVLTEAQKVNEKGQIAGVGTLGGTTHGFLLTPTARVTEFTLPAAANSLTVPVTFKAVDNDGPVMYLITESATVPAASDAGWSAEAPTTYTFSGSWRRTAHAWAGTSRVISADVAAGVALTPSISTSPSNLVRTWSARR